MVHRALLCCDGEQIELSHLPPNLEANGRAAPKPATPGPASPAPEPDLLNLYEVERRTIERAVARSGGNITEAARLLGIGRATLYRKLTAYAER